MKDPSPCVVWEIGRQREGQAPPLQTIHCASLIVGEKSRLGFANGAEMDFAEEALGALGDDHFERVRYIFG